MPDRSVYLTIGECVERVTFIFHPTNGNVIVWLMGDSYRKPKKFYELWEPGGAAS